MPEPAQTTDATPAQAPISVVIVDDHQIFRTGLRAELGPELSVVGEAATVDEAVELIARLRPEVVLLDVHLPGGQGGGGAEVLQRLATMPAAAPALELPRAERPRRGRRRRERDPFGRSRLPDQDGLGR